MAGLVPPGIDLDTDAMSFMGNLVAPIRINGATNWRPYGTAGLGVIRASFDGSADGVSVVERNQPQASASPPIEVQLVQNNLGFNLGGGVMYSVSGRVGLRGDCVISARSSTKTSAKAASSRITAFGG